MTTSHEVLCSPDEFDELLISHLALGHTIVMQEGFPVLAGSLELIIEHLILRRILLTAPTKGLPQ